MADSQEFVAPEAQKIINALGVMPELTGERQWSVHLAEVTGEDVVFSYDTQWRSVRIVWNTPEGAPRVKLFREGAKLLRVAEERGETSLIVEFGTRDSDGTLTLQVFPAVAISDEVMLS
ncbi:hypothetical protein [Streptomyces sp. NPDC048111]|uniref:hypothetical protein n=1 Tax=Streptomyces sp. NPDC048111 TaxID=3365500 RepID=UPI003715EAC0